MADITNKSAELAFIEACKSRDKKKILEMIDDNPSLKIDCVDAGGFTPLMRACNFGDLELVKILLDKGANVNFITKKDNHTPLMIAAKRDKLEIVNYLLEKGAEKKLLQNKKQTASDMASIRGLTYIATVINCYIPYEDTIKPYTKCQTNEDKPKLGSEELAFKLHKWLLLPTLHPIKLLYYVMENPEIMTNAESCIHVVRQLSSKYQTPDPYDDALSIKFHYMAELLQNCKLLYEQIGGSTKEQEFNYQDFKKFLMKYLRRISDHRLKNGSQDLLNDLVRKSIISYPHKTETFGSIKFAMSMLITNEIDLLTLLSQAINYVGSNYLGHSDQDCLVCEEGTNNNFTNNISNKKCGACLKVYYCGPFCQKVDWPRHRGECKSSVN